MTTLKAAKRDLAAGTKALRRQGQIIGSIYEKGLEGSIPIQIPEIDADRFLRANQKGSQAVIELEGKKLNVILKEKSYDALNHRYNDVAFQALKGDELVHNTAPIVLINAEETLGILNHTLSEISYKAKPADLFDKVEIDIAKVAVGTKVYVKDLDIAKNKNIEITTPMDELVLHITERHAVEEDDTQAAADATKAPAEKAASTDK